MRTDHRLSRMLHVLLHMAEHPEPFTSEQIAQMLGSHAAVVRRTMALLRRAGYVRSQKGHGGGWTLSCDLGETTLLDVYEALEAPTLFAMGPEADASHCAVAKEVDEALEGVFEEARALILEQMRATTLKALGQRLKKGHRHAHDQALSC